MAFNFNWSPLTADAGFYERARDLLTTALNKSPKPPIIVDDIFVTEFNLGSVPPDLEILEIGDLAEDRFRGIFKMCYSGDAFLTLATRVQVWLFQDFLSYAPSHHIGALLLLFLFPPTIRQESYCGTWISEEPLDERYELLPAPDSRRHGSTVASASRQGSWGS